MNEISVHALLARGNGAVIVHRELEAAIRGYRVTEIDPYCAALPPLYRRVAARELADAEIVHVVPDCGPPGIIGARQVYTFHNFYLDDEAVRGASLAQKTYYRLVMRRAVRGALAGADRVTVVSRFLAGLVRGIAPGLSLEVIPNGIDVRRFIPATERVDRPLRVLFVGNPSRRKGFDLVTRVARALPAGVELAYTAGLRNETVAGDGMRALGRVPYARMHEVYQQADILFFPTRREGFGLCVAEAMACGLPVVSSRCSSIPELVDEGRGGFLLEPDNVAGMVAALTRLAGDAGLRASMGAWNRERALRDFDVQRMIAAYEALFRSLAN